MIQVCIMLLKGLLLKKYKNLYCIGTSYITYHWVCVNSNTMCVTCGAGPDYPVAEPEFTPDF